MQQMLIHCSLLKEDELANLKSEVDRLDIGKLKNQKVLQTISVSQVMY